MKLRGGVGAAPLLLLLASCSGWQSVLDPKGPAADELARLIWSFTILCALIWVLVMIVLAIALVRRRQPRPEPLAVDAAGDRRAHRVVSLAVVLTAFVLVGLTLLTFFANRTLAHIGTQAAVTITVTGHQWWWEVRYEDARPDRVVTSANEIHVPAGKPIEIVLSSTDVIHSLWVPNLAGKLDLIPGRENVLRFVAAEPGTYRGQCAEFCGAQHAHMALVVVAEPPAAFEAWRDRQLQSATAPIAGEPTAGRDVFLGRGCILCHRVRGTPAGGNTGPDLTHLASRLTLAGGTLEMSRGNLAAWIADPQGIKPGVHMPVFGLGGDELNEVVAYLERLE
ncbi:MAG: cytochrome c oxidase subunit II [Geminicoccaceae bacterium]